jgi:site-specific DNA recombinase
MTVGIYIRVSTLEQAQEGYSISAQRERLLAFCAAQGWGNYKFYVDEGISGKDTNRPQLSQLLNSVEQGKISTILVYRLDRFTRSVLDLHKMLEKMDKHNCIFKSATEPYDTSTAMGRMFITIVAALAQWEIENSSERIKMALDEKVSGGERVGNIPFGFYKSEDERLVKNGDESTLMDIIEKTEVGWSMNRVASYLNLINNDRNWQANSISRILRNPALCGDTRWNDKIIKNTHEGYISKERFDKLQKMLDDRSLNFRKDVKSTYLFQGVLACPTCGNMLSVNRYIRKKKDGSEYQGAIYRCKKCFEEKRTQFTPGEVRIEEAVKEFMRNVEFKNIEPLEVEQDDRSKIVAQLEKIEKKREKYQRAWAADLINDKEFEERMNETRDIYENLQKELKKIKSAPSTMNTDDLKKIVFMFNDLFSNLTSEEKKMFIQQFIRKIKFRFVDQPPSRPDRTKIGKPQIKVTDIEFY